MDRNGVVLADNRTVCTISVIHNQVEDTEQVTMVLSELLAMPQEEIRKKVEKYSSREIIRTNVDKETGDQIRQQHLAGVKVDEDYLQQCIDLIEKYNVQSLDQFAELMSRQ